MSVGKYASKLDRRFAAAQGSPRTPDSAPNVWILSRILLLEGILSGCAALPDVPVTYYLPRGSAEITLTQTATCTQEGHAFVASKLAVTPVYRRDPAAQYSFRLEELNRWTGKTDVTFGFHDDGRLKTINANATGDGGAVVKGVMTAATALLAIAGAGPAATTEDGAPVGAIAGTPLARACKELRRLAAPVGKKQEQSKDAPGAAARAGTEAAGATLTIVHRGRTDFSSLSISLIQWDVPRESYPELQPIFGVWQAHWTAENPAAPPAGRIVPCAPSSLPERHLMLREPVPGRVTIQLSRESYSPEIHEGDVWIPQLGRCYLVPVQKAPLFGENKINLELSNPGNLTKLSYTGNSDAAAAVGAIADLAGPFKKDGEPSTANEAKAVQAEADLIYQQQRLVLCQADPRNCPK